MASVDRIRGIWSRYPKRFLSRHFTHEELRYCLARTDPASSLAARFAAKEAFQKCWPKALGWREVWVESESKRPLLHFAEALGDQMKQDGLYAHLSLSHEHAYALAVVVLEQRT